MFKLIRKFGFSLIRSRNLKIKTKIQWYHGFKTLHYMLVLMQVKVLFNFTKAVKHTISAFTTPIVFFLYHTGIYNDQSCSQTTIDHVVRI